MPHAAPEDEAFVGLLLQASPAFAEDLMRIRPRPRHVRFLMQLLGETTGGERQARRTLVEVYAAGAPHVPAQPLMDALEFAVSQGEMSHGTVMRLIPTHRTQLAPVLRTAAGQLGKKGLGLDYVGLYVDLRYHCARVQQRWEREYQRALLRTEENG